MSEDKCVNDCDTSIPDGGTWGYCDNCWNYVCVSSTLEKKDVVKEASKQVMNKDEERRDELRWIMLDSLIHLMEKARLENDAEAVFGYARLAHETWQAILEYADE